MADRYDDYERGNQGRFQNRERREGRDDFNRGDFGREDPYSRREDQYSQGRNRGNWDEEQRFGNNEPGRERYSEQSYGNQRGRERDWEPRGPEWQRTRTEWGRERTGHEGPWGTGSQGFGTGYRSGEFSSGYSGSGGYTGFGSSGSESYSGGAGMYGQNQQRGRFAGRGPKGYQRSDDRIREDVCERLTLHPDVDAAEIEVSVSNGIVTLTGSVDERHSKRMAEEAVENISGVKDVHNQLRVGEREMAGATHQGSGSGAGAASTKGSETAKERASSEKR